MKLCVLIPCYNEESAVKELAQAVRKVIPDVVVIDDGSTDNTNQKGKEGGAVIIRHAKNLGKGAALRSGFQYSIDNGYEGVIVMDGDGQHEPGNIPVFLREYSTNPDIDIMIGNRMSDVRKMPFLRRVTNRVMSFIISALVGQKIPDTQCGFRLIRRRVLESVKLCTRHYDTESEFLFEAARKGFKIHSVPVSTIYRGEMSYIQALADTRRFISLIWRYIWKRNIQ
jgi:glycosyltransferase involved in cell wall biosynthesis